MPLNRTFEVLHARRFWPCCTDFNSVFLKEVSFKACLPTAKNVMKITLTSIIVHMCAKNMKIVSGENQSMQFYKKKNLKTNNMKLTATQQTAKFYKN